jgi:hypothetical protein
MTKMISVEFILGMGVGEMKENGGEYEFKYDVYCKNFCKCSNVPSPSTTKIKENHLCSVSDIDFITWINYIYTHKWIIDLKSFGKKILTWKLFLIT